MSLVQQELENALDRSYNRESISIKLIVATATTGHALQQLFVVAFKVSKYNTTEDRFQ